ncbi:hypothetical protein WR25_11947 [Diploscapter pachys]|uniref:ATP synthase subunit s-like protein n=1 Tax=Diploscapter pachys TaxID=2018661 RepID=A0A2A2LKK2_9BILA|nr:hypothetical protein WR25_11947 [Diploscapter pachys]
MASSSRTVPNLCQARTLLILQNRTKLRFEEYAKEKHALQNFIKLKGGIYITPEKKSWVVPEKDIEDQTRRDQGMFPFDFMTSHTQMRYLDHSYDNIRRTRNYENFQVMQYDQRMIPERLLFLGPDLAAAHFLVHRGAAVKFLGENAWIKKDKWGNYSLPGRKVPGLFIEAIDASDTNLMFEGFDNLGNLKHLRLLRLSNCPYVDDWVLSRVGGLMDKLEMLDISFCNKVTGKGLMGLTTLKKLKHLRLDGIPAKDLAKASILLEEVIPLLSITGVDYDFELEQTEKERRLLENKNVVLDARDNAFVEDENGRLFYVSGSLNERPLVDDLDRPIVINTIRREIPRMSDKEFEELDQLSGGKLRHFLVGSPSGYEWKETTETALKHEDKLNTSLGIPTDPKMLPKEKRPEIDMEKPKSLLAEEKQKFLANLAKVDEEWEHLVRDFNSKQLEIEQHLQNRGQIPEIDEEKLLTEANEEHENETKKEAVVGEKS